MGADTIMTCKMTKQGIKLQMALEELCNNLHLEENCWEDTQAGLFVYRSADYIIQTLE